MHSHFISLYYYHTVSWQIVEIYFHFNFQTTKRVHYIVLREYQIDVKFHHYNRAEDLRAAKIVNYFIGNEVSDDFNDSKI